MTPLATKALEYAISQDGVRESPPGSNRGPEIEKFQRAIGEWCVGKAYCAAFVVWAIKQAMRDLGGPNLPPIPFVAGAVTMFTTASVAAKRIAPSPGCVGIIDHGQGKGHAFFVVSIVGKTLVTCEANTNPAGSREGDGCYVRTRHQDEPGILGYLVF